MFEVKYIMRRFKIMKEGYTGEYAEGIRWSCGQVTIHTSANMGTFRNLLPVDAMALLDRYVKGSEGLRIEWSDEPRNPRIDMPYPSGWWDVLIFISLAAVIASVAGLVAIVLVRWFIS